jgi:hypothetical protein
MDVKISDVGLALMTMDMELDRLDAERVELEMKLEHNTAKTSILKQAMVRLLDSGLYDLGDIR